MSWDKVEGDVTRGPLGLFKWLAIAAVLLFVLFGTLNAVGLIGGKAVERAVIKTSFQYKEGMEQRAAIWEASLIEIDILMQTASAEEAAALRNQRAVISAQLRAITINQ